jgi:hypothetical protein
VFTGVEFAWAKARAAASSSTQAIMICDVVSTSNKGMT